MSPATDNKGINNKEKNRCFIYDDNKKKLNNKFNKYLISKSKLINNNFENIIISPGINISSCDLSDYLKKNKNKIITDLDIFYKFNPEIFTITITGTNGKSTTCKLLYDILRSHHYDVRLTGNIGNPILNEKKINKKTIFVVEASSYQLAYSKYFRSKFSIIINISPDHLERHGTIKNYKLSKLNCVFRQNKNDIAIATMKKSAMDLLSIIINGINDQIIIKILSNIGLVFNKKK